MNFFGVPRSFEGGRPIVLSQVSVGSRRTRGINFEKSTLNPSRATYLATHDETGIASVVETLDNHSYRHVNSSWSSERSVMGKLIWRGGY